MMSEIRYEVQGDKDPKGLCDLPGRPQYTTIDDALAARDAVLEAGGWGDNLGRISMIPLADTTVRDIVMARRELRRRGSGYVEVQIVDFLPEDPPFGRI